MATTQPSLICTTRHAIILAAGESTRTRPLTYTRPKPLISLAGKPLLAHILDALIGLVDDVTLVVGYRAEDIQKTFGSSYQNIAIHYVHQYIVNGTAGALLTVEDQASEAGVPPLDKPFFLLYGDNLISHADVVAVCQERYCMAGLRVADPTAFGVLDIVDGRVERIIEKPPSAPPDSLVNPGIYHFDGVVFPAVRAIRPSPRGEYELTDLIAVLAQQYRVGYAACQGYWIPVGTPWDVIIASMFILEQQASLHPSIAPDVDLGGCEVIGAVQIAPGVQLGAGCRIVGPSFLGAGASIGAGSIIEHSVVEATAAIGSGCRVDHAVLSRGSVLGNGSTMEYSLLDEGVVTPSDVLLLSQHFADIPPIAQTAGLLTQETLCRRGTIVGSGGEAQLSTRAVVPPGSILA